ncbi:DUF503 domain-containing protein [Bacillaceae bacterium S4-13-58]
MIGSLTVECLLYNPQSLKDKRSIIKKVQSRASKDLNVAVSELDFQNLWQRTLLGFVTISSSKTPAEKELQRVISILESFPELEITSTHFEWY